ncbi:hypothetical protein EIK77_000639 [Talaromyces pinophilus]|nr:hypothetical protein EIK77_000639 [Talaromyces pinophilus]
MDTGFAMTDEEYAELLEYEVITGEASQYYIDPRRLGDYLDLTNINLDNIAESEGVVESVEQGDDHESVRAGSVRIKSEPLSEEGLMAARTGSVEVKEVSEDGVGEVEWVDVLPPMGKSPEIKQERESDKESEYVPTPPPRAATPPATTPWTIPEEAFVYHPPSWPTTEPMDEDEEEDEIMFDNAARDLQYCVHRITKDHRADDDDIEMPDAEEEVDDIDTEMGGLEETAEDTPMDCTPDLTSVERALMHPDAKAKLKTARCRRSPGYRRTPSNGSLSSTGLSSSRRSPKRGQKQKKDVFRETLHRIREFSVERVVVQAGPFG